VCNAVRGVEGYIQVKMFETVKRPSLLLEQHPKFLKHRSEPAKIFRDYLHFFAKMTTIKNIKSSPLSVRMLIKKMNRLMNKYGLVHKFS
jgi:hypothetical protein